ncbi:MAG: hypothetical protein V1774_11675 [Candidatus Eisenbacteria bacterium]
MNRIVFPGRPGSSLAGARGVLGFCAGLLLLWSGSAAQAQLGGAPPRVANPALAPGGLRQVALEERWRLGGESEGVFFGVIGQVLADREGNLYLLDSQLNQVHVFGPDGTLLRTLAGEGDGPGEIRGAGDMFLLPGDRIALLQSFPGKAVYLDLKGIPAGGFSFGGSDPSQGSFGVLVAGRGQGPHLAVAGIRMSFAGQGLSDQEYFLSGIDEQGAEKVRYFTKSHQINYSDFVASEDGFDFVWSGRWDMARDGRIFGAPEREAYRIEVRQPDGVLERIIERECAPYQRNAAEKAEARLLIQALARNYPTQARDIVILDTEPTITAMHCRANGELWVRTTQGDSERPAGALTVIDVFDSAGKLRRQIALLAPGDPRQDAVYFVGDDRVIVVTQALSSFRAMQGVASDAEGEAATPMEVICYGMAAE